MKKRYVVIGLLLALIIGWRVYQNNLHEVPMSVVQNIPDNVGIIHLYNKDGEEVTEQFMEDNEWNYKLRNWRSIYKYFRENVKTIEDSRNPYWMNPDWYKD